MNRELQPGDLIGILSASSAGSSLLNKLSEAPRFGIQGADKYPYTAYAVATNDKRILAALLLCGYESYGRIRVDGVERFMMN